MSSRKRSKIATRTTSSRRAILVAATILFGEAGYRRTTTRRIGIAAGVDASMIARHFGDKVGLYREVIRTEASRIRDAAVADEEDGIESTIIAVSSSATLLRAMLDGQENDAVRAMAADAIDQCVLGPIGDRLSGTKKEATRLYTQIALAAIAGISASRSSKTLNELAEVSDDTVAAIIRTLVKSLSAKPEVPE